MFDLEAIQAALREFGLDGWLLYDFRGSNVLARRVLDLDGKPVSSRRFFYMIPARGRRGSSSTGSRPGVLDHLPGEATVYLAWQELEERIRALVAGQGAWRWNTPPAFPIPTSPGSMRGRWSWCGASGWRSSLRAT